MKNKPAATRLVAFRLIAAITILALTTLVGCAYPSGSTGSPVPAELARATPQTPPPGTLAGGGSGPGPRATGIPVTVAPRTAPVPGLVKRSNGVVTVAIPMEQPLAMKVGERLVVAPPTEGLNVNFDSTMLQLATGADANQAPPGGWMWTARASGKTQIEFSLLAPPCDSKIQECPNVPSFLTVLMLDIAP